ncbi:hypothetical protein Gorai_020768 [Gossypium raimondii]|uniref:Uncharacterized protein n=1 Tax=Gossypium raimondii TaxID=29730 RepID=A0A7J8NNE9_GOSRA|nr:hypothetical protein [Gossypium raimondii]
MFSLLQGVPPRLLVTL